MPDDAPAFLHAAASIVAPVAPRQTTSVRTIFTTRHEFDAGMAGFDGPTDPEDGGFEVVFDGRGSQPQLVLQGTDGEIVITGSTAIKQFAKAVADAERLAARMTQGA